MRLIGVDGDQKGVVSSRDALEAAKEVGLDLVEISPNAEPPVCRIMDYGKYQFQRGKQKTGQKKKQKKVQVKEVKFRPGTDVADYLVKLKKITQFLERGDRVKVTLRFRGREMQHPELGLDLLKRVCADVEGAKVDQEPKLEGRQITMMLVPGKSEKSE